MTAVAASDVPSEKRSPSRKVRPILNFVPVSKIKSPRKSPSPNEVQSFPDRRIHWNPDDDDDDDVGLPLSPPPNPPSMLPRAAAADSSTIPKLAPLTPPRSEALGDADLDDLAAAQAQLDAILGAPPAYVASRQ